METKEYGLVQVSYAGAYRSVYVVIVRLGIVPLGVLLIVLGICVRVQAQEPRVKHLPPTYQSTQALLEAYCLLTLDQWPAAKEALEEALALDPANDAAHFKYAQWYGYHQQYGSARRSITAALALDSSNPHYHRWAIALALDQVDIPSALAAYGYFFEQQPALLPQYAREWIQVSLQQARYDEALAVVTALEQQQGYTELVAAQEVQILQAQKDMVALRRALKRRVYYYPTPRWVLEYADQLPLDEGVVLVDSLHCLRPDPIFAWYLGARYLDRHLAVFDSKLAVAVLLPMLASRALGVEEKMTNLRKMLRKNETKEVKGGDGGLDSLAGAAEEAVFTSLDLLARELRHVYPRAAEVYVLGGDIAWVQQNIPQADTLYTKAQQLGDNTLTVWLRLVEIAIARNNRPLYYIQEALSYYPYQFILYFHLGNVYFWQNNYASAAEAYQQALDLDGDTKALYEAYARVLQALGDKKKAKQMMKKAKQKMKDE